MWALKELGWRRHGGEQSTDAHLLGPSCIRLNSLDSPLRSLLLFPLGTITASLDPCSPTLGLQALPTVEVADPNKENTSFIPHVAARCRVKGAVLAMTP